MTVSLVTGAGSGIGRATATALRERGDRVVCVDLDGDKAAEVAAELGDSIAIQADVTVEADCDAMVQAAVDAFGSLGAVVACAGIEIGGDSLDFDAATFRRIVDVNLTGSFLTARASARAMRESGVGGTIVLIGSINSEMALPNAAAYIASKGGVKMLGKSLAVDFAPHGIRVNVIGPGVTDTPMSAESLADEAKSAELLSRIPMDRAAQPEEIARAARFLTSADASYVTGAFIPVDGGWLAG